jgi:hypothetical protein
MPKLSLNKLLWVDCIAAATAGLVVVVFHSTLSRWFKLPVAMLLAQSVVSFCYAGFSFSLARKKHVSRRLVAMLIVGNCLYATACIGLLLWNSTTAHWTGLVYLAVESAFVFALALTEFNVRQARP